jgi:hypothetical protein
MQYLLDPIIFTDFVSISSVLVTGARYFFIPYGGDRWINGYGALVQQTGKTEILWEQNLSQWRLFYNKSYTKCSGIGISIHSERTANSYLRHSRSYCNYYLLFEKSQVQVRVREIRFFEFLQDIFHNLFEINSANLSDVRIVGSSQNFERSSKTLLPRTDECRERRNN